MIEKDVAGDLVQVRLPIKVGRRESGSPNTRQRVVKLRPIKFIACAKDEVITDKLVQTQGNGVFVVIKMFKSVRRDERCGETTPSEHLRRRKYPDATPHVGFQTFNFDAC